jgi:LacI family transcriptional regulator
MAGAGGKPERYAGSATLHDVARESGVSVATASRALNGSSSRNVRQENVDRVLAAARRIGYEPHLSAQAIAKGSTKTAALVVGDVADPYFSSIAAGVTESSEAEGLVMAMAVTGRSPERELEIVRTLRGHRPRAIVVAGSRTVDVGLQAALVKELADYQKAGGHVALISQPDLPFSTVTVDNYDGARHLALALVGRGYRRFAVVRGEDQLCTSRDRSNGFIAGLHEADVHIDDQFIVESDFTRSGGYQAARSLAEYVARAVELVFTVNDLMAIGAMTAFRDLGLTPGRDIAVAGFDDITYATDVEPSLTSVAVPLRELGQHALALALHGSGGKEVITLPTRVMLRDSTPPIARPVPSSGGSTVGR